MSISNYLTFLVSPVDPESLVIALRTNNACKIISASDLPDVDREIITHDVWYLIDILKDLEVEIPKNIIEINLIQRFLSGRPEAEAQTKNGLIWDTFNIMRKYYSEPENLVLLRKQFWSNEPGLPKDQISETLFEFSEKLEMHFEEMIKSLSLDEKRAIFDIEMPVMNVFLKAQARGIHVNDSLISENLDELDTSYYKVLSILKDDYNFKGGPFDSSYIHSYIQENGIDSDKYYAGLPVDQIIEYTKDFDERMEALHQLRKLRITKSALLKLSFCSESIAHIIFNTFGTVTGRIMAVEPPIQFIKKKYRGVMIPQKDHDCLYIDYSNYEPSILAFLSNDKNLISAVNSGEFYNFIANSILDGDCSRDVAKILFIQYSYGASINTLKKYIHNKTGKSLDKAELLASKMIEYFAGVEEWKRLIVNNIDNDRTITPDMIMRRFSSKALSSDKTKRQIINHHVQSAGSVHLKKLILLIKEQFPDVDILVPMFDALLIQVPKGGVDYRKKLAELFVTSFEENFKGIKSEVTIADFAE